METMEIFVKETEKNLLKALTYEIVDGKPVYYRGYKDVLEGKKHPEEVMASSALHSKILEYLFRLFVKSLPENKFRICVGEVGVKINDKSIRSLDMAIFYAEDTKDYENLPHYYPIPPVVAIEVDVKAEVENETGYIIQKTDDLIRFGVKKVIWILIKSKVIFEFEKGKEGRILTWEDEVEVLEGIKFKLSDLIF